MPVFVSGWIVTGGLAIAYHGFSGGGLIWGLLWGVFAPTLMLCEWVALRNMSADTRRAADRMLLAWGLLLLAPAIPAFDAIAAEVQTRIAG